MHQRSLSELQVVSTQQGVSTRRTTQDRALWSSRLRRGGGHRCLCPPRGAPLWAWLLLGALVVPGAWSFLSEEQEELLVELHNHYRGQVSPSASAMLPLKWDTSLKVIAEGYAAKCVWNHNPDLEDTGENLFAGTGPLNITVALEKWFLERLDYNYENNSCEEDKMCGHYTQMVWADTHRVGCAFHLCNSMEGLEWERVSFLVCNYFPAGNYEDERPFEEGDWCSRCPENLQKCENNLCVADTEEESEEESEEDNEEADILTLATIIPVLLPEEEEEEEKDDIEEADIPTLATIIPVLLPEDEEEEEKVVPPPATTDSYVQPATTTTAPSITTTPSSAQDSEEAQLPDSFAPAEVPSTPQGEEDVVEEKMEEEDKEEKEMKEDKKKEDEKRKESTDKTEEKGERDVTRNIHVKTYVITTSAGSVSSSSLLLACLTAILTLRL